MNKSQNLPRLFILGDSISVHYGPYLESYLAGQWRVVFRRGREQAEKNLDQPVGPNGGDSARVMEYLRGKAGEGGLPTDMLLLNCGLHDIRTDIKTGEKQVPLEQYRQNLREIVAIVRSMGVTLLWVRTTPCDEAVHNTPQAGQPVHRYAADAVAYNEAADAIMAEQDIPIADLYTFTCNLDEELYCDHVHFREPVRKLQAAFLAGWLFNVSPENGPAHSPETRQGPTRKGSQ